MNINKLLYLIPTVLVIACNQGQKQGSAQDSTAQATDTVTASQTQEAAVEPVNVDTTVLQEQTSNLPAGYLYIAKKEHKFSDTTKNDLFKLEVKGKDYLNARVKFTITSHNGKEIYSDEFASRELLDHGVEVGIADPSTITDETKVKYIQNRAKTFFVESSFRTPAIPADMPFSEHHTSKAIYNELKGDKGVTAFFYVLGIENGKHIAWSKKSKKVVMFFNCC